MSRDESRYLVSRCNRIIFFQKKKNVFLTSCSRKMYFTDLDVTLFYFNNKNAFIYWWHNMTFPCWKMFIVDVFLIWYSLNELISMNWLITVCISSRASSNLICFGFSYLGPSDMSWWSFSLLKILSSLL